jgi:hypothetical protein
VIPWNRLRRVADSTAPGSWLATAERSLPRLGAAVCLIALTGMIFRALLIPTHFSVWAYGDAQMFNAGVHFAHEGFFAHFFLPEIDPGNPHSFIANNGPNGRYSHYPALHAIVNGVVIFVANRFGVSDVVALKQALQVVYLVVVALGLLGYFAAIKRVCGAVPATLFTVFLVTSPWVTGFGDSLCDQALNIALAGAYLALIVARFDEATLPGFSGSIALVVFLLSRNSIEALPLCLIFALLYGTVMTRVRARPIRPFAVFYASTIVAPIAIGLGLQFVQTYHDFGSREAFMAHWKVVFQSRVGVTGYDTLHLSQFLHIRFGDVVVALVLVAVFAAFLAAAAKDAGARRHAVMQKSAFALAFALGFLAFPFAMPLQALVMQPYTPAFLYVPMMLLVLVAVFASGPSWWDWLRSKDGRVAAAVRAVSACAAVLFIAATVTRAGLALLFDPLSVTGPSYFWALDSVDRQKLAYYAKPEIRGVLAEITRPTDILLFPADFQGGDPHEVNPIVEFYTQRHGVIASSAWNLDYICGVLSRDRRRLQGTWRYYVRPNLFVVPDTSKNISVEDFARGVTAAWAPSCN